MKVTNVVPNPYSFKVYSKAIVSAVVAVLAGVVPFLVSDHLSATQWVNVAILGVGTLGVYFGPNTAYARYTKTIFAVLTAVLTVLASVIVGGISGPEWIQIGLAAAGALGVYVKSNASV